MASESSLPNTESIFVTDRAIAFEIARMSMTLREGRTLTKEEFADLFTKLYMKSWKVISGKEEEKK